MGYAQEAIKPYGEQGGKEEQVERMFDHIAPTYDRLNHLLSGNVDRHWRHVAVRWLEPFRPQRVLDMATGTGDFALLLARRLRPRELVGADVSEGMMRIARQKAQAAGLGSTLRFVREDCTRLSFPAGSFDAVTLAFGARNFADLDQALRELHRVLSSEGHLLLLELSAPKNRLFRALFALYAKGILPLVGRCVSRDGRAYAYLPRTIAAFPQGEAMRDILAAAGFRQVVFRRLTGGICTLYLATK